MTEGPPGSPDRDARRIAVIAAGVLTVLLAAGIVLVVASDEDPQLDSSEPSASAEIDEATGIAPPELEPDEREGTSPEPAEEVDLDAAASAAGCETSLDLPDEGNTHLDPGGDAPDYESNPPTSGDHSPEPLADGAYLDAPDAFNWVHSLEHGRIAIQYDPDLDEESQLALKGLFSESPNGMLLFPNPDLPYAMAASAWTNSVGCEEFGPETIEALRAFREEFRGNGPEPVPL